MNQEEKIYQKIKNASHKTEETSFPGMDKVWNRVEEKLDTKVIKKKSEVWKKLAIAASFLLFFTVGIQLFTTQKELTKPIEPQINTEVSSEQVQESVEIKETEIEPKTNLSKPKEVISEIKVESIQENISTPIIEPNNPESGKTSFAAEKSKTEILSQKEAIEKGYLNTSNTKSNDFLSNRKIYAARSSNMKYEAPIINKQEVEEIITAKETKSEDLVLIDGKLSEKNKKDIQEEDFETYVELKNPIYIINGEEFSEESLFGEKPTSKYAPLNSQKIDSIKVYLPEEAIPIYGSNGKEGIVIITIKTKK